MKKNISSFILICISLLSCHAQELKPDNKKPMYGEVAKSDEYKQIDKDFIDFCITQYGSAENAAKAHINFAWHYIHTDDLVTAMKRFNQAWLLNPDLSDSYFGFSLLLNMQKNNTTDAERFYNMGIKKDITGDGIKEHNTRLEEYQKRKDYIDKAHNGVVEEITTLELK